ncbi:MAG: FAD-dependent oxidoreductase [Crocosphaera sp.]
MGEIIGQENIITDELTLRDAQTATFFTQQQIPAIIKPANSSEVQTSLKLANEFNVSLYPVSGGKNWGYGSRVPVKDDCVVLNLGRLNRIVDFNEDLAYVTLEPGVTQRQLYEFLQQKSSRLWMDATGSSPDSSLIGNTMERGFGHTPYGNRFSHVCGLEVVLPTGELIHTGFGRFPNAQSAATFRWGVGPYLDGLFSQFNCGIITQMTLWLMPAPEYFQAFYFSVQQEEQLAELINGLRPLRLNGTIKSAVHIGNSYKVLSSIQQYPWEEAEDTTPLPSHVLTNFRTTWDIGAWNGAGGLYGTRQQVAEARRLIQKALRGKVKRLTFLDDQKLQLAQLIANPYQRLTGWNLPAILKLLKPVYGLMKGIPTDTQLGSTYWRKKNLPPDEKNPDLDGCGLIWCAPVAPLDGSHAIKINEIATETIIKHHFEPIISMTVLTGRSLGCVIAISYDREIAGEDSRAMHCYNELLEKLAMVGYYPYRLGIQSMSLLAQGEDSFQQLLVKLKNTIDPNHILSPGRYL